MSQKDNLAGFSRTKIFLSRINRAHEEITGLETSGFYGKNMKKLVAEGFFCQIVTLIVLEKKDPEYYPENQQRQIPAGHRTAGF